MSARDPDHVCPGAEHRLPRPGAGLGRDAGGVRPLRRRQLRRLLGIPRLPARVPAAFETLANLATRAGVEGTGRFRVHAPLVTLTKDQIIARGLALGVDYGLTHSCYDPDPDGRSCGRCDSCVLRLAAFARLGLTDPVAYVRTAHETQARPDGQRQRPAGPRRGRRLRRPAHRRAGPPAPRLALVVVVPPPALVSRADRATGRAEPLPTRAIPGRRAGSAWRGRSPAGSGPT